MCIQGLATHTLLLELFDLPIEMQEHGDYNQRVDDLAQPERVINHKSAKDVKEDHLTETGISGVCQLV